MAILDNPFKDQGKGEARGRREGRREDDQERKEAGDKQSQTQMSKMTETPVFIPYTVDSWLRKELQSQDDTVGEILRAPGVRFVERCGGSTVIGLLGASNPWATEWSCERQRCLPCKGRLMLTEEEESRPPQPIGSPPLPRPSGEQIKAIPK